MTGEGSLFHAKSGSSLFPCASDTYFYISNAKKNVFVEL